MYWALLLSFLVCLVMELLSYLLAVDLVLREVVAVESSLFVHWTVGWSVF